MYVMNQAAAGPAANQPFRDPAFPTYNRANYWGEAWGLTIDWIYPYLSTADKATIRKVMLIWGNEIMVASTAGDEHPQPVGVFNDLALLGSSPSQVTAYDRQQAQLQLRWAANNYFLGHMRNLALLALALDPADDSGPATPVNQQCKSLACLKNDVLSAWLYQAYAVFEDPTVSQSKLGITGTNQSLGIASGGLPVEGSEYGASLGTLFQALLGLHTAGYTETSVYGPQVGLIDSTFWNQVTPGFLHTITPTASVAPDYSYLGPLYGNANYGDLQESWITGDFVNLFGPMAVYDRINNAGRAAVSRWIIDNVLEGGHSYLYTRANSDIWGNSYASNAIFYFLVFDPTAATLATDPRLAVTPQFIAPAIGRILARNNWTPQQSWFSFRCSWETINHIHGDCGQFEFYRDGQWLTKEWSGYNLDGLATLPTYHNSLSIQNDKPAVNMGSQQPIVDYGGQWDNNGNNGDPSVWLSVNDNWSYARVDATNLYNHPEWWIASESAMDVKHAVRSIVWLPPDHIVVYDQAQTGHTGRFKRFNLTLVGKPTITHNQAVSVSNGQQLTVTSLLPKSVTIAEQHNWKTDPSTEFDQVAQLEPARYRLVIADAALSTPAGDVFLTVLQGSNQGVAAEIPGYVVSTSGTPYEGATVANTAILFPTGTGAFTSLGYTVPNTVSRQLITGLTPGAAYTVTTVSGANNTLAVTVKTGGTVTADAAGLISVDFPTSKNPTQGGRWTGTVTLAPPGS